MSKTIDLDLIHFGASLAVIKYNDWLSGILEIVKELGFSPCATFIKECNEVDKNRINHSRYQMGEMYPKRRFSIKQSKRKRKGVGEGYKSGAYSFVTQSSSSGCCKLCGGADDVMSSSRKVARINAFDSISCEVCLGWFHVFCLDNVNVDVRNIEAEVIWICPECHRT